MTGKKRDRRGSDERLDRMGRAIVRASAMNEQEAEATASSPFLYARLRSRINAERERREEGERWFALVGVVWRAVPAMALVAIFAFALFLSATRSVTRASIVFNDESLLGARDAGIEHVVFADRQPLSSDEVLATILNGEERETSR
jgi:hypothetical protein